MLEHATPNWSEARGLLWMTRLCAASVGPGDSTKQGQRQPVGIFLECVPTFRVALGVYPEPGAWGPGAAVVYSLTR